MTSRNLGVAVVGYGWMGRVHSQAYLRVRHHYPELAAPRLVCIADPQESRRTDAVDRFGFERSVPDWREVLTDPAVEAVSVTAPNALHREIAVAVAQAGKHLWVEKPVGLDAADARAVAAAVRAAGVQATVGFNYRYAPAVAHARDLLGSGALGMVTHARFRLFSDYAAHPQGALSWRFERALGGSGVLGDLASHGVDLIRYLLGDLAAVVADTAVFIPRRPRPAGPTSHFAVVTGDAPGEVESGDVENEDYLGCLIRTAGGARVVLESSRVAVGEQNNYGFEIHATKGLLRWDFRRPGELETSLGERYADQFVTTTLASPEHGAYARFQPGAGIALGYDDLKVIEAEGFLRSIRDQAPHGATVEDAVAAAVALDALAASARDGAWVSVGR
jgi:predicted dehydrogenase